MELRDKVIRARRCLNRDTLDLPDVIRADIMNTVGNLAVDVTVDKDYDNDTVTVKVEFIDGRKKTYLYELYVEQLHFKYSKRVLEKREIDPLEQWNRELPMLLTLLKAIDPSKVVNKEATPYNLIGGKRNEKD